MFSRLPTWHIAGEAGSSVFDSLRPARWQITRTEAWIREAMKQTQPASSTPKKSQTAHASASHSHIKRPIIGSRHYDAGHRLWSLWHTRGLTLMWRACQCDMTRRVSMYFYGLFAAVGWCSTLETAPQDCLLHCLPLCSYAGTWTRSPFYSLL